MTPEFSDFAARVRRFISRGSAEPSAAGRSTAAAATAEFDALARELFALQFDHNAPYRRFCEGRRVAPRAVADWREIPALPTVAFKELELSCLPPAERTVVFHSSGTTGHRPSRHFHGAESLALYEVSLRAWFRATVLGDLPLENESFFLCLTPPPAQAPHSSLVHMFETLRGAFGGADSRFVGQVAADGAWHLEFAATLRALDAARADARPVVLLGTAFSLVPLLDHFAATPRRFDLPPGSRVMETGGYKGRSRSLPKTGLHALLTERLGVPPSLIFSEYGMSELSSQAYDGAAGGPARAPRCFQFPPWARVQIVSPETGREVADGETGLLRVCDLANAFSVLAIQTEDLAVRRADGFELLGRAARAEPRGCSLLAA